VNKVNPKDKQNMIFMDKWSLSKLFILNLTYKGFLKSGLNLQDSLYLDLKHKFVFYDE
jgi:hypothetical protein